MAEKKKNRRQIKKEIQSEFERTFDVPRLDYEKRAKPIRDKTKLFGVLGAGIVYGLGFAVGMFGLKSGAVDETMFFKLVWVMMIPATVVGFVSWMIISNRREQPVREEVTNYIRDIEGEEGTLWRYAPILSEFKPDDHISKRVLQRSLEKRFSKISPEDYGVAVTEIHTILANSRDVPLSLDTAEEVAKNLDREAA